MQIDMPSSDSTRARAAVLAALLCTSIALVVGGVANASPPARAHGEAHAAKLVMLHEKASLRITSNKGSTHEAVGTGRGTLNGSLRVVIVIENAEDMSATFTGRSHLGTLSGGGISTYRLSGSVLAFSGTAKMSRGTGAYVHAHGSGIHVTGTLNRLAGTVEMTLSGPINL